MEGLRTKAEVGGELVIRKEKEMQESKIVLYEKKRE